MVKSDNLARRRFEDRLRRLKDGVQKGLPQGLVIDRTQLSDAQIAQRLSEGLALFQRVRDADAAAQLARGELHAALPEVHHFCAGLTKALGAYFGHANAQLHEFGIWPGERRPLTAEELAVAHAKSLATRKKRKTMGKRQRLALSDNQPTVVIVDPRSEPTSDPQPESPSPSPSSGSSSL
jgi:hypothetical protein